MAETAAASASSMTWLGDTPPRSGAAQQLFAEADGLIFSPPGPQRAGEQGRAGKSGPVIGPRPGLRLARSSRRPSVATAQAPLVEAPLHLGGGRLGRSAQDGVGLRTVQQQLATRSTRVVVLPEPALAMTKALMADRRGPG
jgi:hypothetical protein